MTSQHNFDDLLVHMTKLSTTFNKIVDVSNLDEYYRYWDETSLEWEEYDDEECDSYCPCGVIIGTKYYISNKYNNQITHVGSVCINNFKNDVLTNAIKKRKARIKKRNDISKKGRCVKVKYLYPVNNKQLYEIIDTDINLQKLLNTVKESHGNFYRSLNGKYYLKHKIAKKKKIKIQVNRKGYFLYPF